MAEFQIHHKLLLDSHRLGRFHLCHLLLHKNAILPWFILVPETNIIDLLDLPDALRVSVMSEASCISKFIKQDLNCPKVNFAAIGNVVPQLHLHVVGRSPDDPCWPAPVWGNPVETADYSVLRLGEITASLVERYGLDATL